VGLVQWKTGTLVGLAGLMPCLFKDCQERQAMVTDWEQREWRGIYWVPGVVPCSNGVPGRWAIGNNELPAGCSAVLN